MEKTVAFGLINADGSQEVVHDYPNVYRSYQEIGIDCYYLDEKGVKQPSYEGDFGRKLMMLSNEYPERVKLRQQKVMNVENRKERVLENGYLILDNLTKENLKDTKLKLTFNFDQAGICSILEEHHSEASILIDENVLFETWSAATKEIHLKTLGFQFDNITQTFTILTLRGEYLAPEYIEYLSWHELMESLVKIEKIN